MSLSLFTPGPKVRARRTNARRLTPTVEGMEERALLSTLAPMPAHGASATAHLAVRPKPSLNSLVNLTNLTVNQVSRQGDNLVAQVTATLNVLGHQITQTVKNVPLTLTGSPADPNSSNTCDVLNLSLGPVHLNLLGLNVNLDNCAGGPVAVSVTGTDAPGKLLGNLVCDVAGLLNNGSPLGGVLNGLTSTQLSTLTNGLTSVLNGVVGKLLSTSSGATAGASASASGAAAPATSAAGRTDILNLHLNPIHLDLVGLGVDTSAICLDVYAQAGHGNLLGNLLTSLSHLLDNNGNNYHAISVLERNILHVVNRLGL